MFATGTASARRLALSVCLVALAGFPGGYAEAADNANDKMPVYMGVLQDKAGEPVVKFLFSDVTKRGQFAPLEGFSISPKAGKCNVGPADDLTLPKEYATSPAYDPATDTEKIPLSATPQLFSIMVAAELTRLGYTKSEEESLPFVTCTRLVWESIVENQ